MKTKLDWLTNTPAEIVLYKRIEVLEARNAQLVAALEFLLNTKWKSIEKDNMEFQGVVTCYQLDQAREALADQQSTEKP